jgi:hypothetical protein
MERGVNFITYFKGGARYKSLRTSDIEFIYSLSNHTSIGAEFIQTSGRKKRVIFPVEVKATGRWKFTAPLNAA